MMTDTQRPTRQSPIINSLAHRLWETSPEAIAQILSELPDALVEELAATTVQVLQVGDTDETND
jgi:hypothetical protein